MAIPNRGQVEGEQRKTGQEQKERIPISTEYIKGTKKKNFFSSRNSRSKISNVVRSTIRMINSPCDSKSGSPHLLTREEFQIANIKQ